ncbi:polysaccharide biosynthesis/export family protein [Chitinophaga cymbidii]|uniref:Polysaccharide biosynthesis protein n=1 Tax=Chitinophaga cymbidii TaxID=1096750 RepID=A0A512RP24_9BACT|nr:polysaccharide biosynthesis/export family protein [Chitinophaga cymbidii]GEP97446.1 polysaccharide biosynthesis protein [Chitinophaga cymbidii]
MQRNPYHFTSLALLCWLVVHLTTSCAVSRKTVYFSDLRDTAAELASSRFDAPVIRPDDILSIHIQTIDPTAAAAINDIPAAPATGSASPAGAQETTGFVVDKNGNVDIPLLGELHLAGLTTYDACRIVKQAAAKYFVNPAVQVRYANFRVTVLGEVARPATYTFPNEKVTVLDAIGLAGDLTIYGKRDNVMLIRDEGGATKKMVRFNLNSSSMLKSPYFYLRQNDVIYVEPGKGKIASNNAGRAQLITIIGAVVSVAIVALSRL